MDCEDGDELDWLRIHVQLQIQVLINIIEQCVLVSES
jgi:hypothetical protein